MTRWMVLFLLLAPASARAQDPQAIQVERALGHLEAHNSGDPEVFGAFLRGNHVIRDPDSEAWRQAYLARYQRLGKLEENLVDFTAPGVLEVVCAASEGRTVTLTFRFEPDPPYRIDTIEVASGGGPPPLDLPELPVDKAMDDAAFAAGLEAWLADLAARDVYSGAALVRRDGRVIFRGAYGPASRAYHVPNRIDTRFRIGSITKVLTRVALARLVMEGKIRPGDTVADHLPDYPNPEVAARVTVDQLAAHRSGLGDVGPRKLRARNPLSLRGPRDWFELFADEPLAFEPGTQERYSNAGYIVLGAVLEAASGMSYFDCIRRYVFEPAGMERSDFLPLDRPHEDVAEGYWHCAGRDDPAWCNNVLVAAVDGGPSGGSYCTVDDLLAFDDALRTHRLLPPGYSRWVLGDPWPEPGTEHDDPSRAGRTMGWAGGAEGVNAVIVGDGSTTVIVFANVDEPAAEEVGLRIHRKLQ